MTTQEHFTVEEASRWLTCKQPVPLKLLQKLGKDCSMLCRLRNIQHTLRATPHQPWPNEKAYPADVIREVFAMNPDTAPFLPVTIDPAHMQRIADSRQPAPATFNMPRQSQTSNFAADFADSLAMFSAPVEDATPISECSAPSYDVSPSSIDTCSSDSGSSFTGE